MSRDDAEVGSRRSGDFRVDPVSMDTPETKYKRASSARASFKDDPCAMDNSVQNALAGSKRKVVAAPMNTSETQIKTTSFSSEPVSRDGPVSIKSSEAQLKVVDGEDTGIPRPRIHEGCQLEVNLLEKHEDKCKRKSKQREKIRKLEAKRGLNKNDVQGSYLLIDRLTFNICDDDESLKGHEGPPPVSPVVKSVIKPFQPTEVPVFRTAIKLEDDDKEHPLLRPSRKGTRLNEPELFHVPLPEARSKIENIPLLPQIGCSQVSFVTKMKSSFPRKKPTVMTSLVSYNKTPPPPPPTPAKQSLATVGDNVDAIEKSRPSQQSLKVYSTSSQTKTAFVKASSSQTKTPFVKATSSQTKAPLEPSLAPSVHTTSSKTKTPFDQSIRVYHTNSKTKTPFDQPLSVYSTSSKPNTPFDQSTAPPNMSNKDACCCAPPASRSCVGGDETSGGDRSGHSTQIFTSTFDTTNPMSAETPDRLRLNVDPCLQVRRAPQTSVPQTQAYAVSTGSHKSRQSADPSAHSNSPQVYTTTSKTQSAFSGGGCPCSTSVRNTIQPPAPPARTSHVYQTTGHVSETPFAHNEFQDPCLPRRTSIRSAGAEKKLSQVSFPHTNKPFNEEETEIIAQPAITSDPGLSCTKQFKTEMCRPCWNEMQSKLKGQQFPFQQQQGPYVMTAEVAQRPYIRDQSTMTSFIKDKTDYGHYNTNAPPDDYPYSVRSKEYDDSPVIQAIPSYLPSVEVIEQKPEFKTSSSEDLIIEEEEETIQEEPPKKRGFFAKMFACCAKSEKEPEQENLDETSYTTSQRSEPQSAGFSTAYSEASSRRRASSHPGDLTSRHSSKTPTVMTAISERRPTGGSIRSKTLKVHEYHGHHSSQEVGSEHEAAKSPRISVGSEHEAAKSPRTSVASRSTNR